MTRGRLPTIPECERAIDLTTDKWIGNCHCVAVRLVESGLVSGDAQYGHYYGPVADGTYFCGTALFRRHGWIERPGGRTVVDPTRWVFEGVAPYLYSGRYGPDYDPGGQRLTLVNVSPPPPRLPGDDVVDVRLSGPAFRHLADMIGQRDAFSDRQLFWVANLPLCLLGPHCNEVFREIDRVGKKAYIPIDNWTMATRPGGPPARVLHNPFSGRRRG
jgi:hypothetical protein